MACAVLARELASLAGLEDPETAFVAGLLHDIGRLGLRTGLRDQSLVIEHKAGSGRRPQLDVEREVLGYDHAYLGGGLLRVWGIPESIVQGVGFHHAPLEAERTRLACVVHVADVLARMFSVSPSALVYASALLPEAWDVLGLEPDQVCKASGRLGRGRGRVGGRAFPRGGVGLLRSRCGPVPVRCGHRRTG